MLESLRPSFPPLLGSLRSFKKLSYIRRWTLVGTFIGSARVYDWTVKWCPPPRLLRVCPARRCVGILRRGSSRCHMITVQRQHERAVGGAPRAAAVGEEGARARVGPSSRVLSVHTTSTAIIKVKKAHLFRNSYCSKLIV